MIIYPASISKFKLMLTPLAIAASFVFLLCFFFAPTWETNDDVAMSMVAHGYGITANGSPPNLMFSNILWGYLVRAIPEINGVLGYSIATLSVLVIVGAVVIYSMFQLGVSYVGCLSALALILVRPILFPQFTINAGLLMVAAIICLRLYAKQNELRVLVVGCILALLSYLVRSHEFVLVLIVALPLLPWHALLLNRSAKIAIFVLVSAIAVSAVIDHQAYQGDEWKVFNELNPTRAAFTDYGAGNLLKQHPDILERHNYSNNDIDLISNWFFVDSHVANPQALRAMLTELGPLPTQGNALNNAWVGVQTLWHPLLLTTVITAFLLALFRPSWQVSASWGLFIIAIFALGLLGRPGIVRVYFPLVCLLLVAPFLSGQVTGWRNHLSVGLLLVAAIVNSAHVFSESKTSQIAAEQVQKEFANFPNYPVVIWADAFPYDAVYPVLGASSSAMSYLHYGLGTSTLAPFTIAYTEQKVGRGMTDLLLKEKGIPIIANAAYFKMLEIYCKEHMHGQLKELSAKQYGAIEVSQRRCEVKP